MNTHQTDREVDIKNRDRQTDSRIAQTRLDRFKK